MRLRQSCREELRGIGGSGRLMYERIVQFAPAGCVPAFDFADTLQNRLPEIAQHDEWTTLHRFLIQHFPNHGEFDQRPRAALACDVTVAESHQFKKPFLPCCHGYFLIHPAISARSEKTGCHSEDASARFPRATRDAFHYTAITAGTDSKPGLRESFAQFHSLRIIGVTLLGTRTSKNSDDFL